MKPRLITSMAVLATVAACGGEPNAQQSRYDEAASKVPAEARADLECAVAFGLRATESRGTPTISSAYESRMDRAVAELLRKFPAENWERVSREAAAAATSKPSEQWDAAVERCLDEQNAIDGLNSGQRGFFEMRYSHLTNETLLAAIEAGAAKLNFEGVQT